MIDESLEVLLQEGLTDNCLLLRISFTLLTHSLHCVLLQEQHGVISLLL